MGSSSELHLESKDGRIQGDWDAMKMWGAYTKKLGAACFKKNASHAGFCSLGRTSCGSVRRYAQYLISLLNRHRLTIIADSFGSCQLHFRNFNAHS